MYIDDQLSRIEKETSRISEYDGIVLKGFLMLLSVFYRIYEIDLDRQGAQRNHKRMRERGCGRQRKLNMMDDKLIFILFYFRHYPVQELQGWVLG